MSRSCGCRYVGVDWHRGDGRKGGRERERERQDAKNKDNKRLSKQAKDDKQIYSKGSSTCVCV